MPFYEGTTGNDTLLGGSLSDTIQSYAGNDSISGLGGNDSILAGPGNDTVDGGDGHDYISKRYDSGNGVLSGGNGNDTIYGGVGNDYIEGGLGNDLLAGTNGNDVLDGGDGVDTVTYALTHLTSITVSLALSSTQFVGGDGWDTLISIENLIGSAYSDTLTGNSDANSIQGGYGNDTLTGGDGVDLFNVDREHDWILDLGRGGSDNLNVAQGASANVIVYSPWSSTSSTINTGTNTYANVIIETSGKSADLSLATVSVAGSQTQGFTLINVGAATTLTGSAASDSITGGASNDTLIGGAGNDFLVGGGGTDLAWYGAGSSACATTFGSGTFYVRGTTSQIGTDTQTSIENVRFADFTLETAWFSKTDALSTSQRESLVELYVASFNRAPDAIGLNYWGGRLYDGMTLPEIAKSFFVQPETVAAYPASMATRTFVTTVYNNVLSRAPDTEGLNYWVREIDTGSVTKDIFLLAIINGAKASSGSEIDRATLTNKVTVGEYFALNNGLNNTTWGIDVMDSVTSVASTVTAANALTDSYSAAIATGTSSSSAMLAGLPDLNAADPAIGLI